MFSKKNVKTYALALGLIMAVTAGCGSQQAGRPAAGASQVKAMKVMQQDTPLSYEYAGQVKGKNEVKVQAAGFRDGC